MDSTEKVTARYGKCTAKSSLCICTQGLEQNFKGGTSYWSVSRAVLILCSRITIPAAHLQQQRIQLKSCLLRSMEVCIQDSLIVQVVTVPAIIAMVVQAIAAQAVVVQTA